VVFIVRRENGMTDAIRKGGWKSEDVVANRYNYGMKSAQKGKREKMCGEYC
jgi:hypothetical protein